MLTQTERDFELIVVDDGSTDDTVSILTEAYGKQLLVIEQANQGPSAARNSGAKRAHGEYLAFLDSDDLWMPWTLAIYRKVIEKYSRPHIVTSVPHKCGTEFAVPLESSVDYECTAFHDFYSSHRHHRRYGSGVTVVRRDRFLNLKGFSADFVNAEDLDFVLRLGDSVGFIEINRPYLVAWRQHGKNLTSNMSSTGNGILQIIDRELAGQYPGGAGRQEQRRRIISRHVRSHSMARLKLGQWRQAWQFYRRIISWNLRERRIRYLLAFPFLTVVARSRSRIRSLPLSGRQVRDRRNGTDSRL